MNKIELYFRLRTIKYDKLIYLADFKAKHLLKVRRLADEQQVKGPAPAEVGHNNCIDGHRREELPPGGLEFLLQQTDSDQDLLSDLLNMKDLDAELTSIAPISWALSPMLSSM